MDAATTVDAGRAPDANGRTDTGAHADAGALSDAGSGGDAGTTHDAATPPDAGTTHDAATPPDAGTTHDAATPPDAGPPCGTFVVPSLRATRIGVFERPTFVTFAPGDPGALYVVEARGTVQRFAPDRTVTTFLDVQDLIVAPPGADSEQGLLGLAFHPDYATNGRFFVAWEQRGGSYNEIAEFRRIATSPPLAAHAEVAHLVHQLDPEGNHNGGMLAFGADGFLYAGIGDGGGGNDEHGTIGNGQNLMTLHGKILRLDVDASASEFAAAGNPFATGGGLPQIWAYGLRNPWRFSFDRVTHDLYIGDVGQTRAEEIDFQPASSRGGENYGWRAYEGDDVFDAPLAASHGPFTAPLVVWHHAVSDTEPLSAGCSAIGGYVYRGRALPELTGVYLFADLCSVDFGALQVCDGAARGVRRVTGLEVPSPVSFGEDESGELYVASLLGGVYRIERAPVP